MRILLLTLAFLPLLPERANGQSEERALSRDEAEAAIRAEIQIRKKTLRQERQEEVANRSITLGPDTLRWNESTYGQPDKRGQAFWIGLRGGGEVPQSINDEQWRKHGQLYRPTAGLYVTPRAPTDTWFMWNEPHVDALLERLIEDMVLFRDVDPDRVYLMGYSAGGNGVFHLAPRMADRFAATAEMAGYPSGAPLTSLRNLPFAMLVGAHDTTFDRVRETKNWRSEFAARQKADPGGYRHFVRIYPNCGHWMEGRDQEALPWLAKFRRNPWPRKIVWTQDEVPKPRFYWLETSGLDLRAGATLNATVHGQTLSLQGDRPERLTVWLRDELVDLDQPIRVVFEGECWFEGKVPRRLSVLRQSLAGRLDDPACATARLDLTPPRKPLESQPVNVLPPHEIRRSFFVGSLGPRFAIAPRRTAGFR